MPELGKKFECAECGTRFYDLGRPTAICPKCGADQRLVQPSREEPRPARVAAPVVEEEELADEVAIPDAEEDEVIVPEDDDEEVEDEDEDEEDEA